MKPNMRTPAIFAALVVAAIGATLLLRGRVMPDVDVVETPTEPAVGAPAIADSTSASPTTARSQAGARRHVQAAVVEGKVQDTLEQRRRLREAQRERTRALHEQSAGRYAAERPDPAWAPAKIGELTAIAERPEFAEAGAKPASLGIDCRSTMCRLEAQFANQAQAENWIRMYTSSIGGAMPNSVVSRRNNPDGSVGVEIHGRAR